MSDATQQDDATVNASTAANNIRLRSLGKSAFERIAREHPTLILTLTYLGMTFVGLVYDLWFYAYFRINILDYSETGDFLLSAVRNPLVIILSLLPILLLLGLQRVRNAARAKSARYDRYVAKYEKTRWNSVTSRALIYGCFIAIYAILFTQLYVKRVADNIRAGNGRRITLARVDGVTAGERPVMLGSTTKFFFLYYPGRKQTEVVPVENTTLITIDSRRRKERQADSLAALKRLPKS